MILNDTEIDRLCTERPVMVSPYIPQKTGYPSFGRSSFGYDISLGTEFKVCEKPAADGIGIIDPKNFKNELWRSEYHNSPFLISPGGFVLARSVESFNMPDDVMAVCVGKSTYARCGLIVNVTPLEPGWKGVLTLELHNTTQQHIRVYPRMGISQLVFFRGDRPKTVYSPTGRYQDQIGVTFPRESLSS